MDPSLLHPPQEVIPDAVLQAQKASGSPLVSASTEANPLAEDKFGPSFYKVSNGYEMLVLFDTIGFKSYFRKPYEAKTLALELTEPPESFQWIDMSLKQLSEMLVENDDIKIQQRLLCIPIVIGGLNKLIKLQLIEKHLNLQQAYRMERRWILALKESCYCLSIEQYFKCLTCNIYFKNMQTNIHGVPRVIKTKNWQNLLDKSKNLSSNGSQIQKGYSTQNLSNSLGGMNQGFVQQFQGGNFGNLVPEKNPCPKCMKTSY